MDDDPAVLVTAEALLADRYDVATAADGFAAVLRLRARPFDVVCTDYTMPGMDGLEVLHHATVLQEHFVGVLVGSVEHTTAVDLRRFYTLLKPYSAHLLLDIVARASRQAEKHRGRASGVRTRDSLAGTPLAQRRKSVSDR